MIPSPGHLALHRHRVPALRAFPFVCILEATAVEGPERIACPLTPAPLRGPTAPTIELMGQTYAIVLRQMRPMPLRVLGEAVGTAEPARADITRGIDLLFFGI